MSKITNKEFVDKLKSIQNRSDVIYYSPGLLLSNKKEFCYYDGTHLNASGSGLIKSVIYDTNITTNKIKGWYAMWDSDKSILEPSWKAYKTFTKGCSTTSTNFKSIPYGAMLIMDDDSAHTDTCGIYIGNSEVIEITDTWNANTVIISKVNTSGVRSYKSVQSGTWKQWGMLTDIDYTYSIGEDVEASVNDNSGTTVVNYTGSAVGVSSYSPNSLYNYMVYDGSENSKIDIRPTYKSLDLYTTVINTGNKYYIADRFGQAYNNSYKVSNKDIDGVSSLYYYTSCKTAQLLDAMKFNGNPRSQLANCVGYARGRVFELWGQLLDNNIIVESSGALIVPTMNNMTLEGDIYIPNKHTKGTAIPNVNAKNFTSSWPRSSGWGVGNEPKVGSIVSWSSSKYGHVAFVEAVIDRGLSSEYIIVSESGYSKYGAKNIAWTKKVSKNGLLGNYVYGVGYTLNSFCYTPLCQVFGDVPTSALSSGTVVLSWDEVTAEDVQKMYNINESLSNSRVTKELNIGDKVVVEWFGYKDPAADKDDRTQRINISGAEGIVKKIYNDKPFKYAISTDGEEICGYFDRNALALLE